jgi:micrococcal nuclease
MLPTGDDSVLAKTPLTPLALAALFALTAGCPASPPPPPATTVVLPSAGESTPSPQPEPKPQPEVVAAPPAPAPTPPEPATPRAPGEPVIVPADRRFDDTSLPTDGVDCERARVKRVVDGDTVHLMDGRKVRVVGVNTPERGDPLYEEATRLTEYLVDGKAVDLCFDVEREDHYRRTLGYIYIRGRNLSAELVRRGLAYCYTFEPNVHFKAELLALQRRARAEGLGLWSLLPPEPEEYYVTRKRQYHFHRPDCAVAKRISQRTQIRFTRREDAFDSGRNPCRQCLP